MSDYSLNLENYFDFEAYMADGQDPFHPSVLDDMDTIGHGDLNVDEIMSYGQDFDFSVPEDLSPIGHVTQPGKPDADAATLVSQDAEALRDEYSQPYPNELNSLSDTYNINLLHNTPIASQNTERKCRVCEDLFENRYGLDYHAKATLHATLACGTSGCDLTFASLMHWGTHQTHSHTLDHQLIVGDVPLACFECKEAFKNQAQLQVHAHTHQHSPFACACGKTFARIDVLNRHIDSSSKDVPKYPCSHCKDHRGQDGFRRKDHLIQHLKGYHKFDSDSDEIRKICPNGRAFYGNKVPVCPRLGCEAYRDEAVHSHSLKQQVEQQPFKNRAEYNKHMRDVHQDNPFPCTVSRCDRVGSKGYLREKDLKKHISDKHPGAGEYVPKIHHEFTCDFDGCRDLSWSPFELGEHGWIHRS